MPNNFYEYLKISHTSGQQSLWSREHSVLVSITNEFGIVRQPKLRQNTRPVGGDGLRTEPQLPADRRNPLSLRKQPQHRRFTLRKIRGTDANGFAIMTDPGQKLPDQMFAREGLAG